MKKLFFKGIGVYLLISYQFAYSNGFQPSGAAAWGRAGTSLLINDVFSVFNNPAGCAISTKTEIGIFHESRFMLPELGTSGICGVFPMSKVGVISAGYRQYGFKLYREQQGRFAFSRNFGNIVSTSIALDFLSTTIANEYGSRNGFTGSAGMQVVLTKNLSAGAYVFNPFRIKLSEPANEKYGVSFTAGLDYKFSEKVETSVEVYKESFRKQILRGGFEYQYNDRFSMRAGGSNGYIPIAFGIGVRTGPVVIEVSSGYHNNLGFSPQFSLTWKNK